MSSKFYKLDFFVLAQLCTLALAAYLISRFELLVVSPRYHISVVRDHIVESDRLSLFVLSSSPTIMINIYIYKGNLINSKQN